MDRYSKIEEDYPCRNDVIKSLIKFIGNPEETYPPVIFAYGQAGTGKTTIVKEILKINRSPSINSVFVNCLECYTAKVFYENILFGLTMNNHAPNRCDCLRDFVEEISNLESKNHDLRSIVIALDNAEYLRDMDSNILPTVFKLQEYCGLNICVILLSQIQFAKYLNKSGLNDVIEINFPQYSKIEIQTILNKDFRNIKTLMHIKLKESHACNEIELEKKLTILDAIDPDFYNNYLNMCLSVFYKACRDLTELKLTSRACFNAYIEPVLNGNIEPHDITRLWRHISNVLKDILSQVYMRFDQDQIPTEATEARTLADVNPKANTFALSLDLPYYAKYLLIAAFLASYNTAKSDKRLFVKQSGKQKKRLQSVNAKAKPVDKMAISLGPKSFTIDRLLAIFYAILEEKVGLTCNLLSQISTLVHLKLLNFVSGENNIMDGSARLQCTVSLEFVLYIGKIVGFNVQQYLCDLF